MATQAHVSTQDLNLPLIKMQHEMWKNKLITLLNGGKMPLAVSHRDCDLGKWLYSGGFETYGNLPEMRKLEQEHHRFHDRVHRIIELHQAGKAKEAWAVYESLKTQSAELMALIDALGSQMH